MRVHADVERPVDSLTTTVVTDGLGRRENMVLVERRGEGRTTVTGRAERHALLGARRIRMRQVVASDEAGDIREEFAGGGLSSKGVRGHASQSKSARISRVRN